MKKEIFLLIMNLSMMNLLACNKDTVTSTGQELIAPSNFTAAPISARQVQLTWSDNSDNETGFRIERSIGSVQIIENVDEVGPGATEARQLGLSPDTEYIFRVQAFNESKLSQFSDFITVRTLDNRGPWVELDSGTDLKLHAVFMSQEKTGIVVGDRGLVLRTEDSGLRWSRPFSRTENILLDVMFLNETFGIIAGSSFPSLFSTLIQSFTGGIEWTKRDLTLQEDLWSASLLAQNTAIAVGTNGTILKTTDGGLVWQSKVSQTTDDLFSVDFIDPHHGIAVGAKGRILATNDGGDSWEIQSNNLNSDLFDICMIDSNRAVAVGGAGTILQTMNAGLNWDMHNIPHTNDLFGLHFTSADSGFVVGEQGLLLRSIDGGTNWLELASGTSNTLQAVHFYDSHTGMAVGEYGTVLLTSVGGGNPGQ